MKKFFRKVWESLFGEKAADKVLGHSHDWENTEWDKALGKDLIVESGAWDDKFGRGLFRFRWQCKKCGDVKITEHSGLL